MIRLVKRYGSRKLYDTEQSRYVTFDEIATWIRDGQTVRVVDNATEEDVTTQVLSQIVAEQGRRGAFGLPTEALHELIRRGEETLRTGVVQLQHGVERILEASLDRLGPVKRARGEMARLKARIEQLEATLAEAESRVERTRARKRTRGVKTTG